MRVFKNKPFRRFAAKENISDRELCRAVRDVAMNPVKGFLGSKVIKKRLARAGQGTSGGYRIIMFFQRGKRAFFVYGFAKSDKDNIKKDEKNAFKELAKEMLAYDDAKLGEAKKNETITEVEC